MKWIDVTAKLGTMKKPAEFTVCPKSSGDTSPTVTIQSDKRIARVNLETGKVMVSDGKGGHPGFHKLLGMCGAKEYDCPPELLEKLKSISVPQGPVVVLG